ncbi:hypothetical protein C5L31_001956 [Secundilactobacillus malefermentans]|uniref:UvrABC system protein A n=1 Tax=Secundilactobacillus malefermentans TaxID=176292 RepID=A0A4R5NEF4_9LACO|nr:AAA family ATPase [Secundilactobacillus malefermentans]KRM58635.1 excinuclease ATPase subunit [Secundilactobacillus malefermentans DSM 5705 = KCTC 3548]TDG71332.1 hypothetical protein C5L31_001956 [Secundilactobacillus malefermentans]
MTQQIKIPTQIEVRGGEVNNLKGIDVDIPLNQFVAVSGLSGSGKSSLAMGILYAEGSRRYLDALATYTRRRINQVGRPNVKSVKYIPAALALRQRPNVPSVRSTVGTMTEIYNVLRLIYSRLGSLVCPNGHRIKPTIKIAEAMDVVGDQMSVIECPVCGVKFHAFGAEDFAFNSDGACPTCGGLGKTKQIDASKLIYDENSSLADGAIASWRLPGRNFMPTVAAAMGIRTDIPYKDLTDEEKNTVLHGEKKQYPVDILSGTGRVFHMEHALFENAYNAIEDSMATTKSERALKRLNQFYKFSTCETCHGTRLNPDRLHQEVTGLNIAEASEMPLGDLTDFVTKMKAALPENMQALATNLSSELLNQLQPLLDLGLNYLTMNRLGSTLSTGELQRIQLGRTLRTETTGVLYILDEPSVGLHPDNIAGLIKIFRQLIAGGNSLVVVDHETSIINAADWVIEIGPGSGAKGGQVVATGTPDELKKNHKSLIGPFLSGEATIQSRKLASEKALFKASQFGLTVNHRFNLNQLTAKFPLKKISAITGFSGAGKTTLILDSLVPALERSIKKQKLPEHVAKLDAGQLRHVVSVDATPVGKNMRSTVATYTNIMDALRKLFASLPDAKKNHYTASYFSYNNKEGGCPTCGGTGQISLDIQYLPDMVETCPTCGGNRFNPDILKIKWRGNSIADLLALEVEEAIPVLKDETTIADTLQVLKEMGLGYLHLGEDTPTLSGGEAQRLKLTSHLKRRQTNSLFIFDEPTIGLHPLDVQTLLKVFDQLLEQGATILLITHDLDLMANSDYLFDLGPMGGSDGGQIMAQGRPDDLVKQPNGLTSKYLREHYQNHHMTV